MFQVNISGQYISWTERLEQRHARQERKHPDVHDKLNAFHKKLTIWKKGTAARYSEMFPTGWKKLTVDLESLRCSVEKSQLIFPPKPLNRCDWVRNPFAGSETSEGQFTSANEEKLGSVASHRTLMSKRSEINLDAFWTLVEQEYTEIARKARRRWSSFQFLASVNLEFQPRP